MRLMAGALCLDFLNTKAFRPGQPREWLNGYNDLLTFALRSGILEPDEQQKLMARAAQDPDAAAAVTAQARAWREALYRLVTNNAKADDLERINRCLSDATAGRQLQALGNGGYGWNWDERRLERPLWTIALDTAELLVAGLAARVRLCPGHDCGWVFLDAGRGKPRRWCAMDLCGNRAKIKRYRSKQPVPSA